jgi:hypothetical protein
LPEFEFTQSEYYQWFMGFYEVEGGEKTKPIKAIRLILAQRDPATGLRYSAAELPCLGGRAGYMAGRDSAFACVTGYSVIRSGAVRRRFAWKICKKQAF